MTGRRLTSTVLALAAYGLAAYGPTDYGLSAAFALAAEPTLTPRAAGTPLLPSLTPLGVPKGAPKLDPARPWSPPPRLSAPLGPLLFGAGGVAGGAAESAVRVPVVASPPGSPAPPPVFPVPVPAPVAAPVPAAVAPVAPVAAAKAEPAAKTARDHAADRSAGRAQSGGRGDGKFAEWENGCVLPEDLDNPPPRIAPGTRLRARVDSFQRTAPSCSAHIRGVLLEGEAATALADSGDGWVKVRDRWGAVYWVGARLLAPAPQR